MFEKILVATGGSPWSNNAVSTASRLAASAHRELLIVHILNNDPQYQPEGWDPTDAQFRVESEETGQAILEQAAQRATQAHISFRTMLRWEGIPEGITHIAAAEHCDLIVMGTRHLTGDKRLMTGRICNAVIATAPCPILIVPFAP